MSVFTDIRNSAFQFLEACPDVTISDASVEAVAKAIAANPGWLSDAVERALIAAPIVWDDDDSQIDFNLLAHVLDIGSGFAPLVSEQSGTKAEDIVMFLLLSWAMDASVDKRLGCYHLAEQTTRSVAEAAQIPLTKEVEAIPNSPIYTDVPHPLATYADKLAVATSNMGRVLRGLQVERLATFIRRHAETARSARAADPSAPLPLVAVCDVLRRTFPPLATDPLGAQLAAVARTAFFAFRGVARRPTVPTLAPPTPTATVRAYDDSADDVTVFSAADLAAVPASATPAIIVALLRAGAIRVAAGSITEARLRGNRAFHSGNADERALRAAAIIVVDRVAAALLTLGVGEQPGTVAPCAATVTLAILRSAAEVEANVRAAVLPPPAAAGEGDTAQPTVEWDAADASVPKMLCLDTNFY